MKYIINCTGMFVYISSGPVMVLKVASCVRASSGLVRTWYSRGAEVAEVARNLNSPATSRTFGSTMPAASPPRYQIVLLETQQCANYLFA